jgi:hypothetical protein
VSAPPDAPEGLAQGKITRVIACQALNGAGKPCGMAPLKGSTFCWIHDPSKAVERARARRRGGHRAQGVDPDAEVPEVRLRTAADALALLELAVTDCLRCKPSLNRARTLGNLAGIAMRGAELAYLEDRLTELEARLDRSAPLSTAAWRKPSWPPET